MRSIFLLINFLLASACGVAQEIFVDVESIEVRESANTESKVVDNLPRGSKIDLLEIEVTEGKIWYKIIEPAGWVISEQTCNDADCWRPQQAASLESPRVAAQRSLSTPYGFVSEDQLGERWPLTVASGILHCEPASGNIRSNIITFSSGGETYALNGIAAGHAKKRGWLEINLIWKDDPKIPGLKINISELMERGRAVCR